MTVIFDFELTLTFIVLSIFETVSLTAIGELIKLRFPFVLILYDNFERSYSQK